MQVLLEKVLSVGRREVIANTVSQLSKHNAASMFKAAVDRLQSRPARAAMLLPWLRVLLLHHSTALAASPGLKGHLNMLREVLKARVALLQPMLDLSGRLDFMLAHAAQQSSIATKAGLVRPFTLCKSVAAQLKQGPCGIAGSQQAPEHAARGAQGAHGAAAANAGFIGPPR
jgi:hypothetical protein